MIKAYLRYRRVEIAFFPALAAVILLSAWLWRADMAPILYAVGVTAFLFVVWMTADAARFAARMGAYRRALASPDGEAISLPRTRDPIEGALKELVERRDAAARRARSDMQAEHGEQLDYYTMWVHQIKTPISAMRLALEGEGEPDRRLIRQELFRVERYAEMALNNVRLGGMAEDLAVKRVRVDEVARACLRKYAELFILKGLSAEALDSGLVVDTDEKWLAFILEQLISNAVKYTSRGGVRLYGEGRALVVEDSGVGIRKEDLPRVFDKGYTGSNGRLDKRASGLGLYMAKRAADRLSIELKLSGGEQGGVRAYVIFPEEARLTPSAHPYKNVSRM